MESYIDENRVGELAGAALPDAMLLEGHAVLMETYIDESSIGESMKMACINRNTSGILRTLWGGNDTLVRQWGALPGVAAS